MATGGDKVDSGVECSVCLEPYRGQQPKILPCFHTFCVPCLAGLVTRRDFAQVSDTPALDTNEEEGRPADIVTCPTCRRVIPVPAGGVNAFQTNFYLDSNSKEEDGQPVPCTLCDGDQTAHFHCSQCQNDFCPQCRCSHDKLCRGGQVRALQDPSDSSSSSAAQSPSHRQVRQQLQKVEDALKKLTEEKRKLNQEREAMDDSISVRYATMLRHAADARDTCCLSLREVYDGLTECLNTSMVEAWLTRDTLQQQLSSSQPAPVSASQRRAALFMEGELPMILDRDLGSCSLLQYHTEDNTSLVTDAVQSFMGKIVRASLSSGPAQSQAPSGSPCFQDSPGAMSSDGADPKSLNDLYEKVEDLAGQVTSLQSQLSTAHSKLSTEQSTLHREVTTLKDHIVQLKVDHGDVVAKLSSAQADITALQGDDNKMKKDITALQGDDNKMKKDITALQGDDNKMKKDITVLQGNGASLKDVDLLKSDMAKIQGNLSNLESRFVTANTQVGFTVWLSETVTTNKEQTLIFDRVNSNVGGGYDAQSGKFTAPVTGTYCFLANTSPNDPDVEKEARLAIVVQGEMKALVHAKGSRWSTGHAVAKVTAGQEVWLRSWRSGKNTYCGGHTSFSGALLQAEV